MMRQEWVHIYHKVNRLNLNDFVLTSTCIYKWE